MQTLLAALALVAAVTGLAYSNFKARAAPRREAKEPPPEFAWPVFVWAAALVIVGFAVTLPSRYPFSPGLTLGWGLLLGGALGLYAALESNRPYEAGYWWARGVGLLAAAVFGVSLILLVFRGYPNEALVGYSLGAALVAAVWRSCASPARAREGTENAGMVSDRSVELFALSAVALALGARLGIAHFPRSAEITVAGGYWSLPPLVTGVAVLGAIAFAGLVSASSAETARRRPLGVALIATALAVIVAILMAWKLFGDWRSGLTVLGGAVGFGLAAWLACEAEDSGPEGRPVTEVFGVALVALAVMAFAFTTFHGYGESLALSSGLPLVILISVSQVRSRRALAGPLLTGGFVIVLLLVLYRFFLEKNGAESPFDFQQHYNYFGIVLGTFTGLGLLAYGHNMWQIARSSSDEVATLRSVMTYAPLLGLAVVLTPGALLVVWGLGALSGFLIGLVLAELFWLMLLAWVSGDDRLIALAGAPHSYLLGMSLVAIQFSPLLLSLGDASRLIRVSIVGSFVLVGLLWALLKARVERRRGLQGGGGLG